MPHIDRNKNLLPNARRLRREMTRHERHLWYDFLKDYPAHIYKQRIIGNYIADFYCPSANLVIELDGNQHYTTEGMELDADRTEIIEQYDIKVMRIHNSDIDSDFDRVCRVIDAYINAKNAMHEA